MGLEALQIRIVEIDRREVDVAAWDAFATQCAASFRCGFFAARAWQLDDGRTLIKMRHFVFYDDRNGQKIGQCVISISDDSKTFMDSLQLLQEYSHAWKSVMLQLLERLGPGRYKYGSLWNIKQPREDMVQDIDGVSIDRVERLPIQAVDFARWESWDHYFAAVSNNARRSTKRALRRSPPPRVRIRQGLSTLLDVMVLTRLHRATAARKKMNSPIFRILLRNICRTIIMRKFVISGVATLDGRAVAGFAGIEFGLHTYYMFGGSRVQNGGAAWLLMLTIIRRAYDRTDGRGKFLMGVVRCSDPGWENLSRSREQCRVVVFPSSTVTFTYSAPRRDGEMGADDETAAVPAPRRISNRARA